MIGFYTVFGYFGTGKTQYLNKFLKKSSYKKYVNITNFYSGYSNLQIGSTHDLSLLLKDMFIYHQYVNNQKYVDKLFKFKQSQKAKFLEDREELFILYPYIKYAPNMRFNIGFDELSVFFNSREFKENFGGKNAVLLDYIYQFRKLNTLFFGICQMPGEIDKKINRLSSDFRMFCRGFKLIRWYYDMYFIGEEFDPEKAEKIGFGLVFDFFPIYKFLFKKFPKILDFFSLDYCTSELIIRGQKIYQEGKLLEYLNEIGKLKFEKNNKLEDYKKMNEKFILNYDGLYNYKIENLI